ncbi:MAG: Transcriptional regulator [uncultured Aureispira sp.]|uniref:Transcriptional regulator n=1 Tax=uncultured Aureispira sp. TaxID=1331704 RepID=A0A6S6U8N0_9BACT|nr:MAG: Transcriptional regulator [uncultured Aureispira sp.]
MKYKLLTGILPYLEQFEDTEAGETIDDFVAWMKTAPTLKKDSTTTVLKSVPLQGNINAQICQLIALMYKYVRSYYKKGFKDSPLQTMEDFGFLATLAMFGDLRKNELIQKNTSEFTSGMEVIRRLERNDLIQSFLDQEDRRARRVKITKKGQAVFYQTLPVLKKMGDIATGELTESETQQLFELLNKLNYFHNPIFHEEKEASLDTIIKEYVEV